MAKVDQLSIDTVSRRAPAIFVEQTPPINAEGRVSSKELEQFRDDRLDQGGDRKRVVHARLGVADADFKSVEHRMQPNVPPDFLGIVDATGLDQQLAVIFVLGKRFEGVRNSSARK